MKQLITKTKVALRLICLFAFLGTANAQCPAGITWTSRTSGTNNDWSSVTYGNGLFVAVSQTGTGNRVMTSPDGITWTSRTSAADNAWSSVTYGNGLFVAVSQSGTGNRVMTSPDGITWTSRTSAANNSWYSVTYGNGLYVAVSDTVMTSPDGITWTSRTAAAGVNTWKSVTYGNGVFVAVGDISQSSTNSSLLYSVMTSSDGITWTIRSSASINGWSSLTYGNGLFVAVSSGKVMTSPNGITWTSRTSAANNEWKSVTYGNGMFVAVARTGTGNRVMTSFDGITWTSRSSAADNLWLSVTYGNGTFVAVDYFGLRNLVMTSSLTTLIPSVAIAANPGNSITTGTSVTFTATPTNGGSTPAYQWKKNGTNVGTNSVTYTDAALINGDSITCVLSSNNPCASPVTASSTGITMVVAVAPTITTTGALSAFTSCAGTASAQQSFNVSGANLTANIIVTPPTGFELSTISGSGFTSSVTLTQSGGSVTSTTVYARLTASASGTVSGNISCVSTGATTKNVAVSGNVNPIATPTFTAVAPICSGATLSALPTTSNNGITGTWLPALNNTATTEYTFTPTSGQCANTTTMTLTVTPNNPISISSSPSSATKCEGEPVTFSVGAVGAALTYQWRKNTINIAGATNANYYISSASTGDNGDYDVIVYNPCGVPATSSAATLSVIPRPIIPSQTFCKGATVANLEAIYPYSRWYTVAIGGTLLTSTTTLVSGTYYASQTVNGVESLRAYVDVVINALPTTPGTISGTVAQGPLVGTTTTANYSITPVAGATSYLWTIPSGVNIVSGQGITSVVVNFKDVAEGAGAMGNLMVQSVNNSGCKSVARNLALTKALLTAPTKLVMTNGVTTSAITSFAKYMGTATVLKLTATSVTTASSYEWELPEGVNRTDATGNTSSVPYIYVNFLGVTNSNTFSYYTSATTPVLTNILRIGVKAKNGTGLSTTANAALVNPTTTSTAKLLTLSAIRPASPANLKMYDLDSATPTTAITDISKYIGTSRELTLIAAASVLASAYSWEIPTGVNVVTGTDTTSNSIKVNFLNVPHENTAFSLVLGVRAVNGISSSIKVNTGTSYTATTLLVTAAPAAAIGAVVGSLKICSTTASSVTYTIASLAKNALNYAITVPEGCTITEVSDLGSYTSSYNPEVFPAKANLTFTINYPAGFIVTPLTPKTITITSLNNIDGVEKVLKLTNVGATCTTRIAPETGVEDEFSVVAYPNPSTEGFRVISGNTKSFGVKVYDMLGRSIEQRQLQSDDLIGSNYAKGIYNVIVNQGANLKTLRVIKK